MEVKISSKIKNDKNAQKITKVAQHVEKKESSRTYKKNEKVENKMFK